MLLTPSQGGLLGHAAVEQHRQELADRRVDGDPPLRLGRRGGRLLCGEQAAKVLREHPEVVFTVLPELAETLEQAGLSNRQVEKIFYGNVLRVYDEVLR